MLPCHVKNSGQIFIFKWPYLKYRPRSMLTLRDSREWRGWAVKRGSHPQSSQNHNMRGSTILPLEKVYMVNRRVSSCFQIWALTKIQKGSHSKLQALVCDWATKVGNAKHIQISRIDLMIVKIFPGHTSDASEK